MGERDLLTALMRRPPHAPEPPSFAEAIAQLRPAWMESAACRGEDPTSWFADARLEADLEPALTVCRGCPVRLVCLEYALAAHCDDGIWAGTTPSQPARARRDGLHPVELLDAGRASHRATGVPAPTDA